MHPKLSENVYLSQENIWNFRVIQENVMKGPTFSTNFDFGAQLCYEIFKISNPIFSRVFYKLMTFPKCYFASKSVKKWLSYRQKNPR